MVSFARLVLHGLEQASTIFNPFSTYFIHPFLFCCSTVSPRLFSTPSATRLREAAGAGHGAGDQRLSFRHVLQRFLLDGANSAEAVGGRQSWHRTQNSMVKSPAKKKRMRRMRMLSCNGSASSQACKQNRSFGCIIVQEIAPSNSPKSEAGPSRIDPLDKSTDPPCASECQPTWILSLGLLGVYQHEYTTHLVSRPGKSHGCCPVLHTHPEWTNDAASFSLPHTTANLHMFCGQCCGGDNLNSENSLHTPNRRHITESSAKRWSWYTSSALPKSSASTAWSSDHGRVRPGLFETPGDRRLSRSEGSKKQRSLGNTSSDLLVELLESSQASPHGSP